MARLSFSLIEDGTGAGIQTALVTDALALPVRDPRCSGENGTGDGASFLAAIISYPAAHDRPGAIKRRPTPRVDRAVTAPFIAVAVGGGVGVPARVIVAFVVAPIARLAQDGRAVVTCTAAEILRLRGHVR